MGRYELAPNFILTITREQNRLYAQATGQPTFEVFPESDREFFTRSWTPRSPSKTDGQGKAHQHQLILHQNGLNRPAKRIE